MKIFFLRQHKTPFGGAENYLSRLVSELKKNEIACEIVHSLIPKFLPSWLKILFFNFQVCFLKNTKFYFSLERITCPDIYRAGDGVHKVYIKYKQRRFNFNLLNTAYCFLEKRCFQNAKHIIANSHFIEQQIIDTYHISPQKISVIYNGIPLPASFDKEKSKSALLKSFNLEVTLPVILFVGSGFERKGVADMLKHLAQLNTPFHAFIVGKEKQLNTYKKLSQKLGLDNHVTFTGPRKDVEKFYQGSDLFLFPTHYEPFSNVVLEAMGYGNVVFTTAQNGASEILDDYFVMKTPDDNETYKKIEKILKNSQLLKEEQSKNIIESKNFSIERNVQETMKVINEYIH